MSICFNRRISSFVVKNGICSRTGTEAGEIGHTVSCVDGEQKCVDDLGSEGAIFAKCQEAMLAGRLPELKGLMEKDGRLRMERIRTLFCII